MLLEAQNSLIRESKTRERRCSIEKNKRRFMLWFFHNRVFPRPGNRTGDQATGIFLSLSEQESHFKSSPFSLPKSIIPDVCLNRNLRTNSTHTHTQSYLLWYLTISHVHMRFRIGDSSNVSLLLNPQKTCDIALISVKLQNSDTFYVSVAWVNLCYWQDMTDFEVIDYFQIFWMW